MATLKKDKREYSTEFKIDAARLVEDPGVHGQRDV